MNLLTLNDNKLATLHRQAAAEIARRAKAATNGHDAASIICGNEWRSGPCWSPLPGSHSILFVGPPNCGKTMLRAVALELGLGNTFEARPCPCGYHGSPIRACDCSCARSNEHVRQLAGGRHYHRGSPAAATGTQRATGNGRGRDEGPDRPHVQPHRPDLGPAFGQPAQVCLRRIWNRPRCPQSDHRHRPDDCQPGLDRADWPRPYLRSNQLPGVPAMKVAVAAKLVPCLPPPVVFRGSEHIYKRKRGKR